MPYRKRKKPHRGIGTAVGAMCPIAPNALWAMDFQFDTTAEGRSLKLLNIVDEYTRECPAIVVDRSVDADKVVATLDRLALRNAWIESFNGRLRDELLNGWCFDSLLEAQVLIEDWRIDYNVHRLHSAHGELTPSEFAQAWTTVTNRHSHSAWTTHRGPLKQVRYRGEAQAKSASLAVRRARLPP